MPRALIVAACGVVCVHASALPSDEPARTFTVSADSMSVSGNTIAAAGRARATYGDVELTADRIEVNTDSDVARAVGNARIQHGQRTLTGDELTYYLRSGDAVLVNGRAEVSEELGRGRITAIVISDQLRIDQGVIYVTKARFTTCDRPRPHWMLRADRLKITPHVGMVARGTRISMYGLRSPAAPEVKFGFHERRRNRSLFPGFGISARDGPYVGAHAGLRRGGSRWAGIRGRIGAKAGFRGRAFVSYETGPAVLRVAYGLKESVRDEVSRNLIVDRMPELTIESAWRAAPRHAAGGLQFRTLAQWGRYRSPRRDESGRTGRTIRDRTHARAELLYRSASGMSGWEAGIAFRQSYYGGPEQLSVLSGRIGAYGRVCSRLTGSLNYVRRFPNGTSPFEFDDVDIREELESELDLRVLKNWAVGAQVRYDVDRGEARRAEFSLSRIAHCLEYTLSYDTVLKDFGFTVNIPGLR